MTNKLRRKSLSTGMAENRPTICYKTGSISLRHREISKMEMIQGSPQKPKLTLQLLKAEAKKFVAAFGKKHPELFGVTDGKAVGTYVEAKFNVYLQERYTYNEGNAAIGIDFPELEVDVK